ncbi:hypothetical protein BKA63DRAFT_569437 [Paraphoma chrysanthemicola]|nr:hypothetical protein BKA63DRAFT_569437 [Paraphoma chrysanthemicola]
MTQSNPKEDFEAIDLNEAPFPEYLPLRPNKRSFWRKPVVLIAAGIFLFTLMIAGTTIGSIFVGREMQKVKYRNIPTVLIKSTTTVMIMHTETVADYSEYTDMRLQSTVIVTATEFIRPEATSKSMFSLPLLMTHPPPQPAPPSPFPSPVSMEILPPPTPSAELKLDKCFTIGPWMSEQECNQRCNVMSNRADQITACKVDKNGMFGCEVCHIVS